MRHSVVGRRALLFLEVIVAVEAKLGSADYSLVARGPHDLFTFCMCAGGHIIPSVSDEFVSCDRTFLEEWAHGLPVDPRCVTM